MLQDPDYLKVWTKPSDLFSLEEGSFLDGITKPEEVIFVVAPPEKEVLNEPWRFQDFSEMKNPGYDPVKKTVSADYVQRNFSDEQASYYSSSV